MKKTYDVAYGKTESREIEDFSTKAQAIKFAFQMADKNQKTIFINEYDEDGDLINYYLIQKN